MISLVCWSLPLLKPNEKGMFVSRGLIKSMSSSHVSFVCVLQSIVVCHRPTPNSNQIVKTKSGSIAVTVVFVFPVFFINRSDDMTYSWYQALMEVQELLAVINGDPVAAQPRPLGGMLLRVPQPFGYPSMLLARWRRFICFSSVRHRWHLRGHASVYRTLLSGLSGVRQKYPTVCTRSSRRASTPCLPSFPPPRPGMRPPPPLPPDAL